MPVSDIVTATTEMPATPEGMIRKPQTWAGFDVKPPEMDELRRKFTDYRDTTSTTRLKQKRDRAYYDGEKQLDSEVRATLKMRGQPAIYTNRVRPAIDGILGVLDGSKVDPRAYPRNPDDQNAADIATKTLRFIADKARFAETKLDCAETFLIEGPCAAIIEGDAENVYVTQIRWEEFFHDPRSRRNDFKDARYMGFAKWMYADQMQGLYPDAYAKMGDPVEGGLGLDQTWEDRPESAPNTTWCDRRSRRILVVTLFYSKAGEWYRCVYCAAGVFDHALSGYLDKGRNINPIEAERCYVDGDNNTYGRVRDMIPIQDEINARRSRLLHLNAHRQITVETGSIAGSMSAEELRKEAVRADAVLPEGASIVPTMDIQAGAQLLLAESKSEIERMGPTPAVLGRQGESGQSGRARMVLQQAGLTELARPLGRFSDWENRCYRQMWMRAQQLWQAPMWIRVTDDLKAPEFIQINEPEMGMVLEQQPVMDEAGQPVVDPATGQPAMQMMPAIGVTGYKNRLAELDMDIMVDTVPDQVSLQHEVWGEIMQLVSSTGQGLAAVFQPEFELMIEASPLADKARVLELIRKAREGREQNEIEQLKQQLQKMAAALEQKQQNEQADTAKTMADAKFSEAKAEGQEIENMANGMGLAYALQ